MNLTLLYIYGGLFLIILFVFKIVKRQDNPFKKISFWMTQFVFAIALTIGLIYIVLRAFGGSPEYKEGLNQTYFENGKLQSEFFIKDGQYHGYSKDWYENGQLSSYSKYLNGVAVDTFISYYENGQIMNLKTYKDGDEISSKYYYENGQIHEDHFYKDLKLINKQRISYFPDGTKEFEITIDQGTFEGPAVYYYHNGKPKYKGKYKQGQKDGVWYKLDSNTSLPIDSDKFDFNKPRQFKETWD